MPLVAVWVSLPEEPLTSGKKTNGDWRYEAEECPGCGHLVLWDDWEDTYKRIKA